MLLRKLHGQNGKRFFTDKVTAAKDSDVPACKLKSPFRTPKNILGKVGWPFFKFT